MALCYIYEVWEIEKFKAGSLKIFYWFGNIQKATFFIDFQLEFRCRCFSILYLLSDIIPYLRQEPQLAQRCTLSIKILSTAPQSRVRAIAQYVVLEADGKVNKIGENSHIYGRPMS